MSKHTVIGIFVFFFVCTFMTMVYKYAAGAYLSETSPPTDGNGHHAIHASGGHQGATPGPVVETPMSVVDVDAP